MRDRFQREITFESRVREKSGTRNTEFYSLKPEIDIHCTKAPFLTVSFINSIIHYLVLMLTLNQDLAIFPSYYYNFEYKDVNTVLLFHLLFFFLNSAHHSNL